MKALLALVEMVVRTINLMRLARKRKRFDATVQEVNQDPVDFANREYYDNGRPTSARGQGRQDQG